jgi:hypothetical protein
MTTTKTTAKAVKATVKPTVKKTAHGLTLSAIGLTDAFAQRFILRGLQYHEGKGNVSLDAKASAYTLTPDGVKAMSARPGLQAAKDRQSKGGKSEQGTQYAKAPAGFPVSYVFPFGKREEGTKDSQAAFAALMLAVSGK